MKTTGRRMLVAGFGAMAFMASVTSLVAGPLTDAAAKAESLAASGNGIGAHDAMRSAVSDFSAGLAFSIGKAAFVSADPVGYGMYNPRTNAVFKSGEALVSYVEPIGMTWNTVDGGKLQTRFTVDLDILATNGEVLANQKAFGSFTFTSFLRNQEIYATLTTDVTGAAAGDYVLRFHFNDLNSGKTASVDQKFTIEAPPPTP